MKALIEDTLTEKQKDVIAQAIGLIAPYDKEKVSYQGYYFLIDGDDGNSDYDTCSNDECMEKQKVELKLKFPESEILEQYEDHRNDENFDSCSICGEKLSDRLNGMEQEFDHHKKHSRTREDLTNSDNAFCITNMLNIFPTYEHRIDQYERYQYSIGNKQPYYDTIERQKKFYAKVVRYANHIIKVLS